MCKPEQEAHGNQHVASAPKQPTLGRALLSASIQAHLEGRQGSGVALWGGTCSFPWERMWRGSDRWIPTNRSQLQVAEYLDERAHGLDTWKQLTLVSFSAHNIIRTLGRLTSGSFLTPCCWRVRSHLYYILLLLVGRPHWVRSSVSVSRRITIYRDRVWRPTSSGCLKGGSYSAVLRLVPCGH